MRAIEWHHNFPHQGTCASIWMNTYASLVLYAAVFGSMSGAYVGLTSVVLVDLLGMERLTNAFGLVLMFQGIASCVGPPLCGQCPNTVLCGLVSGSCLKTGQHFIFVIIMKIKKWYTYVGYRKLMILYTLWSNIFNIRIMIIIIDNKKKQYLRYEIKNYIFYG